MDGTDARMWIRLSQARPAAEQPVRIPSSRLTAGGIKSSGTEVFSASEVAELEVGHPVSTVVAGGGEGGQSTTGCGRPRPEHAEGASASVAPGLIFPLQLELPDAWLEPDPARRCRVESFRRWLSWREARWWDPGWSPAAAATG